MLLWMTDMVVQPGLPLIDPPATERDLLVARWQRLTGQTLPQMAEACHWPISQDHCFMRVCLDIAFGAPWHSVIRRPALRHMTYNQLKEAVEIAELIAKEPKKLFALNQRSIDGRQTFNR